MHHIHVAMSNDRLSDEQKVACVKSSHLATPVGLGTRYVGTRMLQLSQPHPHNAINSHKLTFSPFDNPRASLQYDFPMMSIHKHHSHDYHAELAQPGFLGVFEVLVGYSP